MAAAGAARGWERVHAHFAGEAAEWAHAVAAVLGVPASVTVHAVDLFRPRPALAEVLRAAPGGHRVRAPPAWIAERYGVAARVVRCGVPTDVPRVARGRSGR
ncbi:MAG: hypothetical protein R3F59_15595 [Myxococcota bacterium]